MATARERERVADVHLKSISPPRTPKNKTSVAFALLFAHFVVKNGKGKGKGKGG
jgi:hypothetical protein